MGVLVFPSTIVVLRSNFSQGLRKIPLARSTRIWKLKKATTCITICVYLQMHWFHSTIFHTIFQGWEWLGLALLSICDSVLFEAPSPENLSTVFEFILKGFDALGMKDTWIKWWEYGEHGMIFTHFERSEIAEIFVGKNTGASNTTSKWDLGFVMIGKPFSWLFCVQEHQEYELVQADNPDLNKADKCTEDSPVSSSSWMCRDCTKNLSLRDPTQGYWVLSCCHLLIFIVDRSGSDQSRCLFSESAIQLNFRSAGAGACEHFQGLALDGWELNFSAGRSSSSTDSP